MKLLIYSTGVLVGYLLAFGLMLIGSKFINMKASVGHG